MLNDTTVGVKFFPGARFSEDMGIRVSRPEAFDELMVDGRIAELEELLQSAKVVQIKKSGAIDIGCKVTLHIKGKKEVYTVVGEWEADPAQKKISHESPLGKALLGKKVGDHAEVEAPAGKILYKILHIE